MKLEDQPESWQNGYYAQAEYHPQYNPAPRCPYDEMTEWLSAQRWHAGYLYREENGPFPSEDTETDATPEERPAGLSDTGNGL